MVDVYITGSSIVCSLGNDKKSSIEKLASINNDNYRDFLDETFEDISYYKIKQKYSSKKEKFFTTLKNTILAATQDAALEKDELKELQIYLASTSMNISTIEEDFFKTGKLSAISFDEISSFVEDLVGTKYPSIFIQTACTSSANCIIKASDSIKGKHIKKALVVGFEFFNTSTYSGFNSLMLISQSGIYKPFDRSSDGLILGEACSCVVLEDKKRADSDFKIISSATAFDNYSITSSNPDGVATFESIDRALKNGGLSVGDLTALKAHATGSENSNLSEANAIDKLFKHHAQKCDVVVLKPYIGHTLGSCGTNEIILLCESIKQGTLPKTINFKEPYSKIEFKPLLEDKSVDGAVVLFHFVGFGGSNTSIVLSNKG